LKKVNKVKKKTFFFLILILLLQLVLRIPFLEEPLERDEGTYGYVAQRILAGELPYRDVFDHKPPTVYYLYLPIVKWFGPSIFALRLFTALYSLLTTLAVFGIGWLILGETGGLLAAFFYALYSGGPLVQGTSSNTETFMVLPLCLALLCLLFAEKIKAGEFWLFLAGLFSGLAVMIKPVAGFNFLAILGYLLIEAFPYRNFRSLKSIFILLVGFFIFPFFWLLYFTINGAVKDFFFCLVTVNQHYLKTTPTPPFFLDPRYGLSRIFDQIKFENGPLWLASLFALIAIFVGDLKKELLLLAGWSIFSLLGVISGNLFFGHYFMQVIPAFSLLSSYGLIQIFKNKNHFLKIMFVVFLFFLFIVNLRIQIQFYTRLNPYQISWAKYGWKTFGIAKIVAQELSRHLKPRDEIFVWAAEPEIYFYLNKKAPTKYPYYFVWMQGLVEPKNVMPFEKQLPRYIIFGDYCPKYPKLEKLAKENYHVKEEFYGWRWFERNF